MRTTIGLEARADGPAIAAGLAPPMATADHRRTAAFFGVSAHSRCSDGEIFLAGELPVEVALRR